MGTEEARRTDDVIVGMFPINSTYAKIFFNSGTNASYVSVSFISCLDGLIDKLANPYIIETVDGHEIKIKTILRNYHIKVDGQDIPLESLLVKSGGFNVVLKMDWLKRNKVCMNCERKTLEIEAKWEKHRD
jgi:hypothetical protein